MFKLRFTDLLGNRYNTRAIVVSPHSPPVTKDNFATSGADYMKAASHSIQTALDSLPNFAVPHLEITTTDQVPAYFCNYCGRDRNMHWEKGKENMHYFA